MESTTYSKEDMIRQYNEAGYALFPCHGKVAAIKKWNEVRHKPGIDPGLFPENFGVNLKDDDLVVDIDPRNFPTDDEGNTVDVSAKLRDMLRRSGVKPPIVKTGTGEHWYFKKPADILLNASHPEYRGVNFQRRGKYVIGAGCKHPSGATYRLQSGSFDNIPQAPDELIELLRYTGVVSNAFKDAVWREDDLTIQQCIKRLQAYPIAVEGCGGDETTFKAAAMLRDLGLREDTAFRLMVEHYNPRCIPMWEEHDLQTKIANAYQYAKQAPGHSNVQTLMGPFTPHTAEVIKIQKSLNAAMAMCDQPLVLNQHGHIRDKMVENVVALFRLPSYNDYNNPVYNLIRYNEFTENYELAFSPPWENQNHSLSAEIRDDIIINLMWFFKKAYAFNCGEKDIRNGIVIAGSLNRYHPIQSYLNAIEWDGKPRLDRWLIDYCGAEDTRYSKAVSKNTLLSAVARVFDPGCQVDTMTVLEGPQGSGKSSVVQILGGQFAGTLFLDPHQKDTIMNMRHNWINEIAEMEFTRKADIAAVKHFISNRADTLRMPYGHSSATYKRQCIFIGSINPDADGGYLRDTTGNRRFWPVKTEKINLAGLKAVRDQLFAEAKTRYFKKEAWFMNTPELLKLAELEQETRREIHPWAEVIARHLKTRKKQGESNRIIYPSSLAVAALGLTPASLDIQSIKTIGNILQVFGYKAVRTRGSLHYVKNDAGLEDLW